jgi:hypothetical protein
MLKLTNVSGEFSFSFQKKTLLKKEGIKKGG